MTDVTTNLGKIAEAITATGGVAQLVNPPSLGDNSSNLPTTAWVLANIPPIPPSLFHGQCRLSLSGANLKLSPYNGNKLIIGGQVQTIPSAGVSLPPTSLLLPATITNYANTGTVATYTTSAAHGLSVGDTVWINASTTVGLVIANKTVASVPTGTTFTTNTPGTATGTASASGSCGQLLYVYAFMSGVTMTLEAVSVTHSADATSGVEIKSGDSTRTLVGMCRTINNSGSPAFVDSLGQRFVGSWFNRVKKATNGPASNNTAVTSGTYVEVSSTLRVEFLAWGDDGFIELTNSGPVYNNVAGNGVSLGVGIDSLTITGQQAYGHIAQAGFALPLFTRGSGSVGEGYHVGISLGYVTGATGNFNVALCGSISL